MRLKKLTKYVGKKIMGINKNQLKNLPDKLVIELDKFVKRNLLVVLPNLGYIVCERCIKAYVIKKAENMNIKSDIMHAILEMPQEAGHNGYYLDKNNVIKL